MDDLFTLPNGKVIHQVNPPETALQYRNLFQDRALLRHGIALEPGSTFVDVGANVGLASLFAHWHAKDLTIHAFEPSALVFGPLEQNFRHHAIRGKAWPVALGSACCERMLVSYPDKTAMSGFHADHERDLEITRVFLTNSGFEEADIEDFAIAGTEQRQERVEVTTLSAVWEITRFDRIDLLKINVERSEQEVMAGIEARHWPAIRQLVLQVHEEVQSIADLRSELEARGYRVAVSQDPLLAGTGIFEVHARRRSAQ